MNNIQIISSGKYIPEIKITNEELEKKYEDAYTVYLEALDKYVMDSIYKKVKKYPLNLKKTFLLL